MKIRIEMEIPGIDGDLSTVLDAAQEFAKTLAEELPCSECEGNGEHGNDDCETCDGTGERPIDSDTIEASVSVEEIRTTPTEQARNQFLRDLDR